MKKTVVMLVTAAFAFSLVSCLSTPPATPAAPSDTGGIEAIDEPAETAASIEAARADGGEEIAASAVLADQAEPPAAANGNAEAPETAPVELDGAPVLPPGERVITFYPEPDLLIPELSSQNTVAPASKPAAEPAVKPAAKSESAAKAETAAKSETAPKAVSPEPAPKDVPPAAAETKPVDTGIWTSEPTAPAISPQAKGTAPQASRSVSVSVGQTLTVWYPGSGWVYLGDASTLNGLAYDSRKLDKSDTLFQFKALKPGSYALEFSRYDVLSDSFSDDALAVTVIETQKSPLGAVRAPDYRSAVDIAAPETTAPVAEAATPSKKAPVSPVVSDEPGLMAAGSQATALNNAGAVADDGSTYLEAARAALALGDGKAALSALDSFFSRAVTDLDEGWYLRGQAYEANGAAKNVKKALEAYQTLVAAYPDSGRWKDADARIRYIKRFYLDIR